MILTQCAVCATDLGLNLGQEMWPLQHTLLRAECQEQHWKEGGTTSFATNKKSRRRRKIQRRRKVKEAVAAAVEKCADDTKGQTCYICTQALHWKTKEGLVRGCSCRGTSGFAHVSCLAEQAKILVAEAEENNLDADVKFGRFCRWHTV